MLIRDCNNLKVAKNYFNNQNSVLFPNYGIKQQEKDLSYSYIKDSQNQSILKVKPEQSPPKDGFLFSNKNDIHTTSDRNLTPVAIYQGKKSNTVEPLNNFVNYRDETVSLK